MKSSSSKPHAPNRLDDFDRHAASGFTLLELMIVLAILALTAAALAPGISSSTRARVDLVAEKVAVALRFTRSEAIRTGIPHGIVLDHDDSDASGKDIVVYQLDTSGSPFDIDHVVYQPVSKNPYDIVLIDATESSSIAIRNSTPAFTFDGVGASQHLHFDPEGKPVYYHDGEARRLLSGIIQLGGESDISTVTISSVTGQVSVQ